MRPVNVAKYDFLKIKQKALNRDDFDDEVMKRQYVEALSLASQNIVKNWDTSNEKVFQRQENERNKKKKDEELSRIAFYNKLMESKRQERDKIINDAKEIFFKQKDEPRLLEGALVCAEMLREQEAQREFNKKLKEDAKRRDLEYSKFVDKKCMEWKQEQITKRQRRIEKQIKDSLIVKEQAEKSRQNKINKRKQTIEMEREDKINEKIEFDRLNELALKMKKMEQEKFKERIYCAMNDIKLRKDREKELDKKENELIEIYHNTQLKIEDMRKKREREIQNEKNKMREMIREVAFEPEKLNIKSTLIEVRCETEQKKFRQREIEILEEEEARHQLQKETRIMNYKDWLEKEKKDNEAKNNILLWEIANRIENVEYTKLLNAKMKKDHRKKITETKQFNIQQRKELAERKAQENRDLLQFYSDDIIVDMEAADEKFLTYANQLVAECEALGRPTHPLHRVINDYKARYMVPDRKLLNHLKTHFKSNSTNPPIANVNNTEEKKCECIKEN